MRPSLRCPLRPLAYELAVGRPRSFRVKDNWTLSSAGLWLMPRDLNAAKQESTGVTAAAVNSPVGLGLDRKFSLARGAELVSNGTFADATGWSYTGGAGGGVSAISGDLMVTCASAIVDGASRSGRTALTGLVVGTSYEITATAKKGTAPETRIVVNSTAPGTDAGYFCLANAGTPTKTVTATFVATATTMYVCVFAAGGATANQTALADNISVREIPGIHLSQATAAARVTLSQRVNLLTKTEDLSNAVWVMGSGASTTAKRITFTADAISRVVQAGGNISPGAVTVSVQFDPAEAGKTVRLGIWDSTRDGTSTGNSGNLVIPASGRVSYSWTGVTTLGFIGIVNGTGATGQTLDLPASGGGVQLEIGTTATRYQRVNTATDYDTAGFPYFWSCDGIDDGLASATFAAGTLTSDMDCFIAVRRNSAAKFILASKTIGTTGFFGCADSGSGSTAANEVGTPTHWVNGVQVPGGTGTTRAQLDSAMAVGGWMILEIRNLDLSTWTAFVLGLYGATFYPNANIGGIILCAAGDDRTRALNRKLLGREVGLSL